MHNQAHQDLALEVAQKGIVLLKNEKDTLPLHKDLKAIAVIGPDADNAWAQLGDYSPAVVPHAMTSILDGIKQKVSPQTKVLYAKGCDVIDGKADFTEAVAAARKAQIAVVVVGETPNNEGKGTARATDGEAFDVASLDLTGNQGDLVRAIAATGTPVVLVLVNGRPLSVRWEAEHLPAIVEAWEPGERGGEAVAGILFGDINPSGRLAITIPRSSGQLPVYHDYKPAKAYWIKHNWARDSGYVDMPASPLYPFGFGLSYTSFQYSNLHIDKPEINIAGKITATMDVTNTGKKAGTDTVQLYLHERYAPIALAVDRLRGFERVTLNPGETKTVTFTIRPEDEMLLDEDMLWKVSPGTFDVLIGSSAENIALRGSYEVKAAEGPMADRGISTQPDLAR
jgi:beta-glucosidase